jgi:hypothetical protein
MIVFRLIGLLFITVALMALGSDALRSIEAGKVQMRSLAEFWQMLEKPSFDAFSAWSTAHTPEAVTGPLNMVLSYPSWAVLGVIGLLIAALLRLRRA